MPATATTPRTAAKADVATALSDRPAARVLPLLLTVMSAAVGLVERPQLVGGFLIAAAIFIPLEQLLPLIRRAGVRPGAWVDLAHTFANRIPITIGTGLVLAAIAPLIRAATPEIVQSVVASWPVWVQLVTLLLLIDLVNYASHRALHEVPWLWRLHAVHHSSVELDWLSTSRGHPIDQILVTAASTLPLYALEVELPFAAALLTFSFFFPYLAHANTRLTLRPLSRFIVTPAFHHWHHAADSAAINRNYGSVFTIWDTLFRTWHLPLGTPERYGTDEPMAESWTGHLAAPFRRRRPLPEETAPRPMSIELPPPIPAAVTPPWVLELPIGTVHVTAERVELGGALLERSQDPDHPDLHRLMGHLQRDRTPGGHRYRGLLPYGAHIELATGTFSAVVMPDTPLRPVNMFVPIPPPPAASPALGDATG